LGNRWEFTQYDNDVYAISLDEPLQKQTDGTGSFTTVSGGPQAACIANVRRWVVVGDTYETGTNIPYKVRWSQIDNPDAWTISEADQSGSQTLDAKDGRVMAIAGGEYGIILQQHAITRMSYVGTPIVWQFDKIDSRNGCEVPGSVVQVGRLVFFLSNDGWRVTDGSGESVNIGDGTVNEWFNDNLSTSNKSKISGAYNNEWRCVVWTFPTSSGNGSNNAFLLYSIPFKRWARGDYGADVLWEGASASVTLEGIDDYFSSIEDVTPSLDDPFWMAGQPKFLGISSGKLNTYDAEPDFARLETFEVEHTTAKKTRITQVEPVIDADDIKIRIGYRNLPSESLTYTSENAVNTATGVAHMQHAARWNRYRFVIYGDFDLAAGFNANIKPAGNK
jgi:hypothetical protein